MLGAGVETRSLPTGDHSWEHGHLRTWPSEMSRIQLLCTHARAVPTLTPYTLPFHPTVTQEQDLCSYSTDAQTEAQARQGLSPKPTPGVGLRSGLSPRDLSAPRPGRCSPGMLLKLAPAVSVQGAGSLLFRAVPALFVSIPSHLPPYISLFFSFQR